MKKSCYTQNWRSRSFFALKINFFEFFSKSLHKVFQKLYCMTGIKNGQKLLFWILKENSYYAQNGVNGLSVRNGSPLWLCTSFKWFSLKLVQLNFCRDFFETCKKLIVVTVHITLETESILQQWIPILRLFFGLFSLIVRNKTCFRFINKLW